MNNPLVSILINNYNYAHFIADAINSAINQTYKNIEIIVVDDGSTDNSREIIASYKDRNLSYVFKDNGGQASAFNEGFTAARGELIAFLDADDYFYANKIEEIVKYYLSSPEYVMFYHPVQKVDTNRRPLGKPGPRNCFTGSLQGILRASGGWYAFPPTSGLVFNRILIGKAFPIPSEQLRLCADSYLHDTACFIGNICYISLPLAAYRIHGKNLFSNVEYVSGNAHDQRILRTNIRNSTLNQFLINNKMKPVDLNRCVSINIEKWIIAGMPLKPLPKLMFEVLKYPAFSLKQSIRCCAGLALKYARKMRLKPERLD